MDNDREFDQVLYNIQRQGGGIMSLLLFSAQMQMKMWAYGKEGTDIQRRSGEVPDVPGENRRKVQHL